MTRIPRPDRLVDISEPTENVLWEIEELRRIGGNCIVIGQHERIAALADHLGGNGGRTPIERRLAQLLDGQEVLGYSVDRRGLKRFARALRGMLLAS